MEDDQKHENPVEEKDPSLIEILTNARDMIIRALEKSPQDKPSLDQKVWRKFKIKKRINDVFTKGKYPHETTADQEAEEDHKTETKKPEADKQQPTTNQSADKKEHTQEPPKQEKHGASKEEKPGQQSAKDQNSSKDQSDEKESDEKSPRQKNQKGWEKKLSKLLYSGFEKLKGSKGFAHEGFKKIMGGNGDDIGKIEKDDLRHPEMPPSRFEEHQEATKDGETKKVSYLMDYFGRTNRDPFKHDGDWLNPDMKEIKTVLSSINPDLKNALGDILNKFKKEIDPAFGHAKVEPLELISDLEMLNGNICTLGIVSSRDLARDVAARLETNKTKLGIAEGFSGSVIGFFNKNKKRKFASILGVLGLSVAATPAFLLAPFIPKIQREIFKYAKNKFDQGTPPIDSEKIYKLLQSKDLKALRALSLGKGYNLEINNLPRKMRWLEIGTGWCFLPSVKKDYPDQALVYRDKAIVARDTGATVNPKFIVKSPAAWEVFFQHIGKKYDNGTDLPLNGKVFTDDIKARGSKFFLPPDIGTVQNLDLTNVANAKKSLRANTLREIKGDVTIPSNEVLKEFPDGVIYRGNKENLQNLDQEVVRKKFKFAEPDKKPEPEAKPEAKPEAGSKNKPKPEDKNKPDPKQKKHPAKKMRGFFTKIKDAWRNS